MSSLKEVGAVLGLVSFVGLALLALLLFAQARDVRRLKQNARFLIEGGDGDEAVAPADRAAVAVAAEEPEQAAAAAAASAPTDAEAFRRAELARQAAERRQRFEKRRGHAPSGGRERPSWLSEPLSLAVVVVGAILLIVGVGFGVSRLTGGGSDSTPAARKDGKGPCPPSQTNVAILNGTATAGLAAQFAGPLKQQGYKTTPVGNTESPVATSVVMFDPQSGRQCAPVIARIVDISKQQPMSNEIRGIAAGDPVAVVLGDDQAGGSSSGTSSTGSGI